MSDKHINSVYVCVHICVCACVYIQIKSSHDLFGAYSVFIYYFSLSYIK